MDKQILDEHSQIFLEDYNQTFNGLFFHPEAGTDSKLNESLDKIKFDLNHIDSILLNTGTAVDTLLSNTVLRLENIKQCIIKEKERYQDVQMLCNKYTDFDNVKTLDDIKFDGTFNEKDKTYSASVKKNIKTQIAIHDVFGNGYEGNEYVYNDFKYQKEVYDTSVRVNMIDSKISTYYEYSRITMQDLNEETNTYFNKDNEKARCTITFQTKDITNYLEITTEDLGINIVAVQYSLDGIKYTDMNISSKISINNKLDSYDNYGYIYGTGMLSVPPAYYFKITFEADRDKDDVIAYEKTVFLSEQLDVRSDAVPEDLTTTHIVKSAKRSAIKINDISAYKRVYNNKSMIQTPELMTLEGYSIAVFANVYIPQGLDSDAVKFFLTVNGYDYEIVPLNSNLNGTKVIRFSGGKSSTIYTQLINEKITSARLTIVFDNFGDVSGFVNNIKVLIGGEL
jgi:hypothetical protein